MTSPPPFPAQGVAGTWSASLWKREKVGAVQRCGRKRISVTGLGNGHGSQGQKGVAMTSRFWSSRTERKEV